MNAKGGGFKYVKPTRRLSEKVGTQGGIEVEDAMERAEAAVAKAAEEFPATCSEWIKGLIEATPDDEAPLGAENKARILGIANDIRGQGGTFGYPLVTLVADSLVKFVDPRENSADVEAMIVRLHIQALERLIRDRVTGDGGATGVELRTVMTALSKRRQKPPKPSRP